MSRRALLCAAACALLLAPPAAAARSWAQPQIALVTAHGLMGGTPSAFRPDDPLTAGDLADLVSGLTGTEAPMVADPSAPATIAQLDAQLVRALGLLPVARELTAGVRAVGLVPPRWFGTEVVARLIGLRFNHPAAQDRLELNLNDTATRAEAAYSAARVLGLTAADTDLVTTLGAAFRLEALTPLQREVLQTAIAFVGYPYVWGGTSELPQDPFGTGQLVPGGFDCSGFVWRIYKLQAYAGAGSLPGTLKGRTTYAMSGEVGRAQRIPFAKLEPGDVLFFGAHGPRSKPAEIDHMGVYLGGGWFVQSSDQGVALAPLQAGYRQSFAWARRPLAEAKLV